MPVTVLCFYEQHCGCLVEFGPTSTLFSRPKDQRTEGYITGRFG